ncbi:Ribosome-binding protein 1, partial [Ophiophagus hannah]
EGGRGGGRKEEGKKEGRKEEGGREERRKEEGGREEGRKERGRKEGRRKEKERRGKGRKEREREGGKKEGKREGGKKEGRKKEGGGRRKEGKRDEFRLEVHQGSFQLCYAVSFPFDSAYQKVAKGDHVTLGHCDRHKYEPVSKHPNVDPCEKNGRQSLSFSAIVTKWSPDKYLQVENYLQKNRFPVRIKVWKSEAAKRRSPEGEKKQVSHLFPLEFSQTPSSFSEKGLGLNVPLLGPNLPAISGESGAGKRFEQTQARRLSRCVWWGGVRGGSLGRQGFEGC